MKIFKVHRSILPVLAMLICACGNDGNDPSTEDNDKDRKAILTHWVDNIVIPPYAGFKIKLDAMAIASEAFTTAPSPATLSEFRTAWVSAYVEWQKVDLFEFGPADRNAMRNFFNIYPADVAGIASNINDPSVNLELPVSYARQGFPALDYLIQGTGADDTAIIAYYTTDTDASKRRAYVAKLVTRMNTLLNSVITEWNGTYRTTFISKTGLDIGSSMGLVVNAYVLYYERFIRSGKFGIPSGAAVAGGGTIQPSKVEAYYKKDISLTLAKTAHLAAKNFFNGKNSTTGEEGPSLKSYLDALEAKDPVTGTLLSVLINDQFIAIDIELNKLSEDLSHEVQTNNSTVIGTFNAMQKIVRMLKVDMTSAMSVTITYTDNDGD
jgi:predicted lipoprotein